MTTPPTLCRIQDKKFIQSNKLMWNNKRTIT